MGEQQIPSHDEPNHTTRETVRTGGQIALDVVGVGLAAGAIRGGPSGPRGRCRWLPVIVAPLVAGCLFWPVRCRVCH